MSLTSFLTSQNLCGIYEVDVRGTIFYHKSLTNCQAKESSPSLIGRNFFDELADIQNLGELRGHFKCFLSNLQSTEEFKINFNFQEQILESRVKLIKICQRENNESSNLIIVDIRQI